MFGDAASRRQRVAAAARANSSIAVLVLPGEQARKSFPIRVKREDRRDAGRLPSRLTRSNGIDAWVLRAVRSRGQDASWNRRNAARLLLRAPAPAELLGERVERQRVARIERDGPAKRLDGLDRLAVHPVCHAAETVCVCAARVEACCRGELSQRIIAPIAVEVHRAQRDFAFSAGIASWQRRHHCLVSAYGSVPLRERSPHRVEARRQLWTLVTECARDGLGELPHGGDELVFDVVDLSGGNPEAIAV